MSWAIDLAERRIVPDPLVGVGMRRLLSRRLRDERANDTRRQGRSVQAFVREMESEPVAVATRDANEQHYEPPAEFFATVLGPNLKYSSRLWTNGAHDLAQAEDRMLELSCKRAGIEDGMGVLDLGSGSGSLSLWIARRYPGCRTLAVSNSRSRAAFIRERCAREGFDGFEVVTADLNHFSTERRFNRVVPDHPQLDPSRIATFDLLISRQEGSFRIDIETIRTLASVVES